MNERDRVPLTGLWRNTTSEGEVYLAGRVNPMCELVIWKNGYKDPDKNPRAPDYIAYVVSNGKGRTADRGGESAEEVEEGKDREGSE